MGLLVAWNELVLGPAGPEVSNRAVFNTRVWLRGIGQSGFLLYLWQFTN